MQIAIDSRFVLTEAILGYNIARHLYEYRMEVRSLFRRKWEGERYIAGGG